MAAPIAAAAIYAGGNIINELLRKKPKQVSLQSKKQRRLQDDMYNSFYGRGNFNDLFAPTDYDALNQRFEESYARPAMRRFKEEIIPSITGQFRGGGIMESDVAANALARSGRDLEETLAAQRGDFLYRQSEADKDRRLRGIQGYINSNQVATSPGGYAPFDAVMSEIGSRFGNEAADYFFNLLNGSQSQGPAPNQRPLGGGAVKGVNSALTRAYR